MCVCRYIYLYVYLLALLHAVQHPLLLQLLLALALALLHTLALLLGFVLVARKREGLERRHEQGDRPVPIYPYLSFSLSIYSTRVRSSSNSFW